MIFYFNKKKTEVETGRLFASTWQVSKHKNLADHGANHVVNYSLFRDTQWSPLG